MTPDAIDRAAAELAIAMLRFESASAHPPRDHRPPGTPEPGVDAYHFLPDWTAIPIADLADRFMATPSPLLLFPTTRRGAVALMLLDELGPERRRWAEHSIANWMTALDELAAEHGLADDAPITLDVELERLVVPFAAVRRCFARYVVGTGWSMAPDPQAPGTAWLTLVGAGHRFTLAPGDGGLIGPLREAEAEVLWRRLDVEGHDGCRLMVDDRGDFALQGTALAREASGPLRLAYHVSVFAGGARSRTDVRGRIGTRKVSCRIQRDAERVWTLDGVPVAGLDDCIDIDLGFTPATNTLTLRRLGLAIGRRAELAVAWLDVEAGTLTRLPQTYERLDATRYAYTSPTVGYAETLEVDANGVVTHYPGLWRAVE